MSRVRNLRHEVKLARRLVKLSEVIDAPQIAQVELMSDERFDALCESLQPKKDRIKALRAQAEEAKTSMIHMHRRNVSLERHITALKLQISPDKAHELTAKSEWVSVTSEAL